MTPTVISIVAILVLLALRVPIYLAFGIPPAVGLVVAYGLDPAAVAYKAFSAINNEVLLAAPLYLLMGFLLSESGVGKNIVRVFEVFLSQLPGGLGLMTVGAATLFAGMTGSTTADLSALSLFTVPAMEEAGYSRRFALALLGSAATLGVIVPPSIPMILYGFLADVSVGHLFLAGIIPGLILATMMAGYSAVIVSRNGWRSPHPASWSERREALKTGLPIAILPALILLAIYGGVATAVEVGALAVVYAVLVSTVVYRALTPAMFYRACVRTARVVSLLFLIVAAASVLSFFLTLGRTPLLLTSWIISNRISGIGFILTVEAALLLLGLVLDVTPILFLAVPVLLPSLRSEQVDLIYFGVLVMVTLQIAQVHPPIGTSLLVLASIFRVDPMRMVVPMLPFIGLLVAGLLLFTFFPPITQVLR